MSNIKSSLNTFILTHHHRTCSLKACTCKVDVQAHLLLPKHNHLSNLQEIMVEWIIGKIVVLLPIIMIIKVQRILWLF